jgi:hypothetical protein
MKKTEQRKLVKLIKDLGTEKTHRLLRCWVLDDNFKTNVYAKDFPLYVYFGAWFNKNSEFWIGKPLNTCITAFIQYNLYKDDKKENKTIKDFEKHNVDKNISINAAGKETEDELGEEQKKIISEDINLYDNEISGGSRKV